jgi:hypothetical protein
MGSIGAYLSVVYWVKQKIFLSNHDFSPTARVTKGPKAIFTDATCTMLIR